MMPIIGPAQTTFDYFASLIRRGEFDEKPGLAKSGNKRLLQATEPFVTSGELARQQQSDLFVLWSEHQRELVKNRQE